MASPLSPAQDATLNSVSSLTKRKYDDYDKKSLASRSGSASPSQSPSAERARAMTMMNASHDVAVAAAAMASDQENLSPRKNRHSRVMAGNELSPLKIVESQRSSVEGGGASLASSLSSSGGGGGGRVGRSPRKMSPEKRFPVKVSVSGDDVAAPPRTTHERTTTSLEDAVMENEGLKRAMETFEDEQSVLEHDGVGDSLARLGASDRSVGAGVGDETAGPDESMMSTFSTFSAVPNMTMLAKLGHTPSKLFGLGISNMTPRRRDPSPLKSSHRPYTSSGDTDMLLDFVAEQRSGRSSASPTRRSNASLSPSRSTPRLTQQTPTHPSSTSLENLIDFDIPPMPTPRSVPSITPRELESVKSKFLSEISSLKASLSGKEAEVHSLKSAVKDAEMRVGQSLEKLREERALKEQLAVEKEGWENRGREMESMLRKIKEEIVTSHVEREELEKQLEESEKRKEMSEMMYQEAEAKLASLRTGKDLDRQTPSSPEKLKSPPPAGPGSSSREVEIAVERVARELHGLYKSKHETKVAALKKSYESRWEKKVRALEAKLEEVNGENERLRAGPDPDATMARLDGEEAMELKAQAVRDNTTIKELNANAERLEAMISSVTKDNEKLHKQLQQERVEKGELVQLAEELMGMQQTYVAGTPAPKGPHQSQAQTPAPVQTPAPAQSQQDRAETALKTPKMALPGPRSSGIRAPGVSGLRAPTGIAKSSTAPAGGLPRPGPRSGGGIMGSIEKMGNYRGRE